MSNASNLYAEKVFAEHPLALWPLDETVDYLSLISNEDRDISDSLKWTATNCLVSEDFDLVQQIGDQPVYEISSSGSGTFQLNAINLIDKYINEDLGEITLGFYFYPQTENIISIEVGYKYDSNGLPRHTSDAEYFENIDITEYNSWQYISKTFPLPTKEVIALTATGSNLIVTEGSPTKISLNSHGFSNGDKFKVDADYDVPSGLNKYLTYYVINADTNTFEISEIENGTGLEFDYPRFGNLKLVLVKSISPFIRYTLFDTLPSISYIHGFTAGQWSSEFSEKSLGQFLSNLSGINVTDDCLAIEASAYGFQDLPAYYLSRENRLLASNNSMPMVYGSSTLTNIYADRFGGPSIIFPGQGFLNESGQYKTYTVEFWLRISPNAISPRRIFGPIASSDGLYIDGPSLILKVGNTIASHYIGEWYRPMLLNILVYRNGASLVINGEKVFDLSFSTSDLSLPAKTNLAGKDQDWLGFYSYSDIEKFEIDCFAIYSYRVPTVVSKRRWVYGQAVDYPENISSAYSGKSFPIDYTFSFYSNNYIYPDIARWRQGILENMSSINNVLQPPPYQLPDIIFNNKSTTSWLKTLSANYSNGITLKPDSSWVDTDGYLFFEKANLLEQKTIGFYCLMEAPIGFNSTETLFRLENRVNGNYLDVDLHTLTQPISSISGAIINSADHGLLDNDIVSFTGTLPAEIAAAKEYFVIKIDDDNFSISNSKDGAAISISAIAEDSVSFVAYVMRYKLLFNSNTETIIYRTPAITMGHSFVVGLDFKKFADTFGGNVSTFIGNRRQLGVYVGGNKNFSTTFSGEIYRVGFCTQDNVNKLDYLFDTNGIPFLRYQFDGNGITYASGEPAETANAGYVYDDYIADILSHTASYTLVLRDLFGARYLDIATNSYWQDYVPLTYLAKNIIGIDGKTTYSLDFIQYNSDTPTQAIFDEDGNYDTSDSFIKTYVSFQSVESGPTRAASSFANTKLLPKNKIVDPGSDWTTTKYEVINGTIIYPPPSVDINNIAIVVHIEMVSPGIIKNPIRVRSLQLASKALNALLSNPIKTKFGVSIFPYKKYGVYYDYKSQNPFVIYKDNTPHLYLNKHSGLELTGAFGQEERGFSLPINRERRATYDLANIQFSARFTRQDLVSEPLEIMQIETGNPDFTTRIWIEPSIPSDRRFRLYATDAFNNPVSFVLFYINGQKTTNPTISINSWNMLSLAFQDVIDLGGNVGRINFVGPIMFNNVSYFALNATQNARLQLEDSTQYIGIDPAETYALFTGTNKLPFGDNIPLAINDYQYSLYKNLSVQSATIKPV